MQLDLQGGTKGFGYLPQETRAKKLRNLLTVEKGRLG